MNPGLRMDTRVRSRRCCGPGVGLCEHPSIGKGQVAAIPDRGIDRSERSRRSPANGRRRSLGTIVESDRVEKTISYSNLPGGTDPHTPTMSTSTENQTWMTSTPWMAP
jgi:hypothetical protein